LEVRGQLDEAMAEFRRAIALDPKGGLAHYELGLCLQAKCQLDEAMAEYRRAIELDPHRGLAYDCLAGVLLRSGRFAEARTAVLGSRDLIPAKDPQHPFLREKLELCERMLALEARLPALLQGKDRPAAPEYLELARLCREYGRPHAATGLYAAAFAARPPLTDDLFSGNGYNAACAAARAAAGQGSERRIGELERASLRRQALAWLRADLEVTTKLLEYGKVSASSLSTWRRDPDLASLREPAELAKLPEPEREQWQRLWADTAAVLAADPLEQGKAFAAHRDWSQAAARYGQSLRRGATDDGHFWFENAALLLLCGDRSGYARACAHMVEACGKPGGPRAYHVARACTLAPNAVAEASLPGRLAEKELQAFAGEFWSLTEQGALAYRAGRFQESVHFFEQSMQAEPKLGQAVLNWLWLALAHQRLGKSEEARGWLYKAQKWLDQYRDGMPARIQEELGLHFHNWLEAHVLRREAEALIEAPQKTQPQKRGQG
jgi:tetratricopeptide (TPR) repeat protein